jgi:type IV pilus assembly protein PilC
MPNFAYSGRTRGGQTVSGERVADTMDAAVDRAAARADLVTRITPKGKAKADAAQEWRSPGKTGKKVSAKNLAVFTRQFSVMIDAGLPLVQCLDILGSQEEDKNFAAVILQTRADVESGRRWPTRCASTPRRSIRCSPTWLRPARRAASSTRFSSAWRPTSRRPSSCRAGQVGDDLPGRRHRDRRLVVGVILWKVIPTFARCSGPWRRPAAADPRRHRMLATTWCSLLRVHLRSPGDRFVALRRYYATEAGRRVIDGSC